MSFESEAKRMKAEHEARLASEQEAANAKEQLKQERVRPEWGVELAGALAKRGIATATMVGLKQKGRINEYQPGHDVFSIPFRKNDGWVVEWPGRLNVLGGGSSRKNGFTLSEDGDVWKDYVTSWSPLDGAGRPLDNSGAFIDLQGRQWLKANSIRIRDTIGIYEDSIYNKQDEMFDAGGNPHLVDVLSNLAISALVTIDINPDVAHGGKIAIDKDIFSTNRLIRAHLLVMGRWGR